MGDNDPSRTQKYQLNCKKGGEADKPPLTICGRHPTGYPWRVALQRCPIPFHRLLYSLQH
jgi:hypothetical protein